jgi:ATP-dependent Clp protease, protease subunit
MNYGQEFRKYAVKHRGLNGLTVDAAANHSVQNMTRSIIEERPMNFREVDVFSRLMADRIIFFGLPVDDQFANIVVAQMLFLESVDSKKDIVMYINSPGGSVYAGLGIYDTMQLIKPDVGTVCTSLAASMGAVLLTGGAPGKRSALPHARVMIHQPSGGSQGTSKDMQVTMKEMLELEKDLYTIIASHSGRTYEEIETASDRDKWFRASEAKEYGLIDEVMSKK